MIDKIPSLKDFILYVIPGMLICYFGLNVINTFDQSQSITTDIISNNAVLTVIGVIFSFLIGFIFSQLQLIILSWIFKRKNARLRTIQGTSLSPEIKDKITDQVIKVFNLTTNKEVVMKDTQILYLCLNYVKINSNENSITSINRSGNMSTFASALPIPIFLGLWNLFLVLEIPPLKILVYLLLSLILLIYLIKTITLNFRDEWINNIYRQFLILSLK